MLISIHHAISSQNKDYVTVSGLYCLIGSASVHDGHGPQTAAWTEGVTRSYVTYSMLSFATESDTEACWIATSVDFWKTQSASVPLF